MTQDIEGFVKALGRWRPGSADVFNPWRGHNRDDARGNGPDARRARLVQHLSVTHDARLLLCGEAPGYQGARITGVAFSSEKLMELGAIPRVAASQQRLSSRARPWCEPSASIVWGALYELGVSQDTVLWNAFPFHPHHTEKPLSNRSPRGDEIEEGVRFVKRLCRLYPNAAVVAVGKQAEKCLRMGKIKMSGCVRHPAYGGANEFREGIGHVLRDAGIEARPERPDLALL